MISTFFSTKKTTSLLLAQDRAIRNYILGFFDYKPLKD